MPISENHPVFCDNLDKCGKLYGLFAHSIKEQFILFSFFLSW